MTNFNRYRDYGCNFQELNFVERYVWFKIVPFKPFSNKNWWRYFRFSISKFITFDRSSLYQWLADSHRQKNGDIFIIIVNKPIKN